MGGAEEIIISGKEEEACRDKIATIDHMHARYPNVYFSID